MRSSSLRCLSTVARGVFPRATSTVARAALSSSSFTFFSSSSSSSSTSSSTTCYTPSQLLTSTSITSSTYSARGFSTSAVKDILVLADHDNKVLSSSTLHSVSAAKKIGSHVTVLVTGHNATAVAEQAAKVDGVKSVLHVDAPQYEHLMAESYVALLHSLTSNGNFSHVIAATNAVGKSTLPRLGLLLDVQPVTDIIDIKNQNTFDRPVYAGNAIATVESTDAIKVLTIRPTNFEKSGSQAAAPITKKDAPSDADKRVQWISEEVTKSDRPQLTSARVVVAGGRALKSKENFKIVEELADALGGAVGASRAAVDAGYCPNDYQVGQTGKVVAPDLYIAAGISGAIQHLAGMKDSKVIVAINKDKEAPIFQVADYGIEADLFKALPEMTKLVKKA